MQGDLFDAPEVSPYRHTFILDDTGRLVSSYAYPVRFARVIGFPSEEVSAKKTESIVVWERGSHGLMLIAIVGMRKDYPYRDYPTFPGNRLIGTRLRTLWPMLNEVIAGIARERMRRWRKEPRRVTMYFPRWRKSGIVWEKEIPRRRGIAFSVSLRDRMLLAQILLADIGRRESSAWFVSRGVNRKLWALSCDEREARRDASLFYPSDFGEARSIREWYEDGRLPDHFLAWLLSRGFIARSYRSVLCALLETSATGSADRLDMFVDLFDEFSEYQGEILPFVGADLYPRPFTRKDQGHFSFEVIPHPGS